MFSRLIKLALVGALLGVLNACGSGDTTSVANGGIGGTGLPLDNGGIGGTGRTIGAITGYGSIFVNGIEFDTTAAAVEMDGVAGLGDSGLAIGMVVEVSGTVAADGLSGTADSITYRDELEGLVNANNILVDSSLTVMGQTVILSRQTVYDPGVTVYTAPELLPADNSVVVEVSGYPDGQGNIYATLISVKQSGWLSDSGNEIEVKGVVQGLDESAMTFTVGGLSVSYASAQVTEVTEGLADGLYVQIHSSTGFDSNGRLIASSIELEEEGDMSLDGAEGDEYELEGIITSPLSGDLFGINGQVVRVSTTSTELKAGVDLSVVGAKIEVSGTLGADGILDAEEIEGRYDASIHIGAKVEGYTTDSINLLGLSVMVTPTTVITDETATITDWPLNVKALYGGYVEVDAARDEANNLVAVRLKVEERTASTPVEVELEGEVTSTSPSPLMVEGVEIDPNGLLSTAPQEGDELSVKGSWNGYTLTATEIE